MPAPSYTLHTPAGSFRAFSALIAAEYNGVNVTVADWDAASVASMSPTGKAPVLVVAAAAAAVGGGQPQQTIFSSHAIARYIASIRRDSGLTGSSLMEQASVDAWMDFASTELELPACVWFYPTAGYMPFQKAA
jgi:elongation factor 1-gamma